MTNFRIVGGENDELQFVGAKVSRMLPQVTVVDFIGLHAKQILWWK